MGADMTRRLSRGGHACVVFDAKPGVAGDLAKEGPVAAGSLEELVQRLEPPRSVWLMVPAGSVEAVVGALRPLLAAGDVIIDGGNSHYQDDIRRAKDLLSVGIHYVDVGTSGGIWGVTRGYCLMIGGESPVVDRLDPIFRTLAPGVGKAPRTPGRDGALSTAENGYLRCGAAGAGHFVKMVHNGIEYGMMAAYAEGLNILRHANAGETRTRDDAETAPLRHPENYRYDLDLRDVAEVWRRGSVIESWLLDLTASALLKSPDLRAFSGRVSDSGEGRWTMTAAIDEGVPAPVLSAALTERFASRGAGNFADKVLSALRNEFGGHAERAP
jgi:6-phosphogluconate dehydrogenase